MFNTQMIAALMLGMAAGASAPPTTGNDVPRAEHIATMDVEHRAGKLAYFDQIDSSQIDSDQDGVVMVVEMTAAGVIK